MTSNELDFFAHLNAVLDSRIDYLTNLNEQLRRHCANFTALRAERYDDITRGACADEAPQNSSVETKEPAPLFNALDSLDAILAKAKVIRNAIPLPSAPREQQLTVSTTSKAKSNKLAHIAHTHTSSTKGVAPDGRKRNNAAPSSVVSKGTVSKETSSRHAELVDNQNLAVEAKPTWPLKLKSKYEFLKRRNFASKLFVGLMHRISSDNRESFCKSESIFRSISFYGCTWERDSLQRIRDVTSIRQESQHEVSGERGANIAAFMNALKSAMLKLLSKHATLILKLKMKLQQGSSSCNRLMLSSDEQTDLLELWYKGHRLMQLYQLYCSQGGSGIVDCSGTTSSDSGESQSQIPGVNVTGVHPDPSNRQTVRHTYMEKSVLKEVVKQLHALPLCCPVSVTLDEMPPPRHHPSRRRVGRDVGSGSTKRPPFAVPSEESRRNYYSMLVDKFHAKVKVRVQFLVESLLGKSAMKGNLRQLKDCCYQVASSVQSRPLRAPAEQDCQWISALRLYRAMYCALVDECKFHHSCTILKK